MRVVYFGSGSVYSARILDALASTNVVASVILPEIQASGLKGLIRRAAIWRLSREMRHVIARHKLHQRKSIFQIQRGTATLAAPASDPPVRATRLAPRSP